MEDDIACRLEDLVVPLLLETSDAYKPLVAKRRFERSAALLAKQAYWLVWFEMLVKMKGKLAAVNFSTQRKRNEPMHRPEWEQGHQPSGRDMASFAAAGKRAASKLHGKNMPDEEQLLALSFGVARNAVDDRVDSASKDAVMARVLGTQLNAYRMSKSERSDLEALLWEKSDSRQPSQGKSAPRL